MSLQLFDLTSQWRLQRPQLSQKHTVRIKTNARNDHRPPWHKLKDTSLQCQHIMFVTRSDQPDVFVTVDPTLMSDHSLITATFDTSTECTGLAPTVNFQLQQIYLWTTTVTSCAECAIRCHYTGQMLRHRVVNTDGQVCTTQQVRISLGLQHLGLMDSVHAAWQPQASQKRLIAGNRVISQDQLGRIYLLVSGHFFRIS